MTEVTRYRTVWLSDIHLGSRDCKADYLLDFLDHSQIEKLYLVGDIVDMWAMRRQFLWPRSHNRLLHRILSLPAAGTRVFYLPGNHDEPLQQYDGMAFGDVEIHREYIHTTADGRKLLLLHGDQFDQEVCLGPLHSWVGDKGYQLLLVMNRWYNRLRSAMNRPYWSLAAYIKHRVRGASEAIVRYRELGLRRAREQGVDGIVCGHIHHPEIHQHDGTVYCNTGDWVESCSALTENSEGDLSLVFWTTIRRVSVVTPATPRGLSPQNHRKAA